MTKIEIRVPDLGDFNEVTIVEVLVAPGDIVRAEDAIVTIESDKATMDIPAPLAGRIVSVSVKRGDVVSVGSILGEIELMPGSEPIAPKKVVQAISEPAVQGTDDRMFDLVVIGAGPGGYSAAFRAADLGLKVVLIDRRDTLGGVCLNVGCIPSKAILHIGAVKEEAERLRDHGVTFAKPTIDLSKIRSFKSAVVRKLTGGLSHMARERKVALVQGAVRFENPHKITVTSANGAEQTVTFRSAIIAVGSEPVALSSLPQDERIVDSTGALELASVPDRMLVIGGGIIGLEMASIYSSLGARIEIVELADRLLPGVDPDLVAIWLKRNGHRFDRIMVSTKLEKVETGKRLTAHFSNGHTAGDYDLILVAVGRAPNGGKLNVEAAGLSSDQGFIKVDNQMRTCVPHIFAIGDVVGQPMLAHKAVHEGHVAAEAIAGKTTCFDPQQIPSVAYTDPEIAWTGLTETEAGLRGIPVRVGKFPWAASGRAIASGAEYGLTKLVFEAASGRIVGGALVGPHAGDMIGEISLAIELGADAVDIGRTIHPHPTMGESIGMAAEVAEGICTDLLPKKAGKLS